MRDEDDTASRVRVTRAFLGLLAALGLCTPAWADDAPAVNESPTDVAAKAEASASELAASLRSLDSSLSTAAPVSGGSRVLSAEEHDALVEAAMKAQLTALADELDLLSGSLAAGADPLIQKALLDRVAQRASVLSRLGARPARVPISSEVTSELLALWHDVQALSTVRAPGSAPTADSDVESP
jgi:hypothetical protein